MKLIKLVWVVCCLIVFSHYFTTCEATAQPTLILCGEIIVELDKLMLKDKCTTSMALGPRYPQHITYKCPTMNLTILLVPLRYVAPKHRKGLLLCETINKQPIAYMGID